MIQRLSVMKLQSHAVKEKKTIPTSFNEKKVTYKTSL